VISELFTRPRERTKLASRSKSEKCARNGRPTERPPRSRLADTPPARYHAAKTHSGHFGTARTQSTLQCNGEPGGCFCRAWLGPRDQVNSRPRTWPQRRPDFLSVLGRVSRDSCSATKRPRSSATRRQVVRHSALVICVARSQSAKHVLSHSAMRASIVWSGRRAGGDGSIEGLGFGDWPGSVAAVVFVEQRW
jgi:hypothetical protein